MKLGSVHKRRRPKSTLDTLRRKMFPEEENSIFKIGGVVKRSDLPPPLVNDVIYERSKERRGMIMITIEKQGNFNPV